MVDIAENIRHDLCEVTFTPPIVPAEVEVADLLEAAAGFLRRHPNAFPSAIQLTYDEMCGFYLSLFYWGEIN